MKNQSSSFESVIFAFALGGLLGAVIMALFAPQTGEDTRKLLFDKSQELKDKAVKTTNQTGKAVGDFAQQAKDRATGLLHRGQDTLEGYKSNVEEEAKSKSVQFR